MQVKRAAELAGTTVRTVRYYHQIGLLPVPSTRGKQRDYDFTHVARLLRIRWLAGSGVPLATVAEVLDTDQESDDTAADLASTIAAIDAKQAELTRQRQHLETMLQQARDGRRLSPLSDQLLRVYDDMLRRTDDPRSRDVILADREVAEVAAFAGGLPDGFDQLVMELDEPTMRAVMDIVHDFARLPDVPADELPATLDRMLDQTVRVVEEVGDTWTELASHAWADDVTLTGFVPHQFPHPHQLAYSDAALRLIVERTRPPEGDQP